MRTAIAHPSGTRTKRTADFYELWNDLLDESERALEEYDVEWCAVVHRLLMPAVEREVASDAAFLPGAAPDVA